MNSIDLKALGNQWLEMKKQRMENLLKIAQPDEALYREIMLSLGYPKNKTNFLELALITPYSEIKKLKAQQIIENALLYRAGLSDDKEGIPSYFDFSLRMHHSVWNYSGTRPENYPEKRIRGISILLAESIEKGLVAYFMDKIKLQINNTNPESALKKIMDFKGIGIQRKEEMFFNIILPFVMVLSDDQSLKNFLDLIFENYPPLEDNKLTKEFKKSHPAIIIKTVKEYMGTIFLQKKT